MVFGIRLQPVFMGHIHMDEMSIWWLDGLTDILGKLELKVLYVLSIYLSCKAEWGENSILGRFMMGDQLLCSQYLVFIESFM